jgi:hypothetical protein
MLHRRAGLQTAPRVRGPTRHQSAGGRSRTPAASVPGSPRCCSSSEWVVEIGLPARPARRNAAKATSWTPCAPPGKRYPATHLAAPRARGTWKRCACCWPPGKALLEAVSLNGLGPGRDDPAARGRTAIVAAVDGHAVAVLGPADAPRETAAVTMRALHELTSAWSCCRPDPSVLTRL